MTKFIQQDRMVRRSEQGNAAVSLLAIIVVAGFSYFAGQKNILNLGSLSSGLNVAEDAQTISKDNPVIVKVNGDSITRQDVMAMVNAMPPQMKQMPAEQLFPMAIEQLINNEVIDSQAKNAGLGNDPDVLKQLAEVKENLVRSKYVENVVKEKATDELVKKEYDNYVATFPEVEEARAAHILVEDEALAKSLISKLNAGEAFADLAKEHSVDGSGAGGGDLGYFVASEVVTEFSEAAFKLAPGEYTKSPVKSQFGYHIIRLDEKRMRKPQEFAELKDMMTQELQRQVFEETMKEWKEAANIERFDINGNPLPEVGVETQAPAAGQGAIEIQGLDEAVDAAIDAAEKSAQ